MKNQFSILVILCLFMAVSYTQFSRDDFEICYEACRTNFKTAITDATAVSSGDKTTYFQNLFDYEQCVTNISLDDFKTYYATTLSITDNSNAQNGYCKYFFSTVSGVAYDATEINQKQLQTLVETCFSTDCTHTVDTTLSDDVNGTYHFTESFDKCINTCISQTTHEDQKLYEIAVEACDSTYQSLTLTDNATVDTDAYNNYKDCIRNNASCGQLYFYDFSDFQYKTYWKDCHDDCITAYNTEVGADTTDYVVARKDYFTCLQAAPIPSADSFTRLDNTVETGSQILYTSIAVIFALASMLI